MTATLRPGSGWATSREAETGPGAGGGRPLWRVRRRSSGPGPRRPGPPGSSPPPSTACSIRLASARIRRWPLPRHAPGATRTPRYSAARPAEAGLISSQARSQIIEQLDVGPTGSGQQVPLCEHRAPASSDRALAGASAFVEPIGLAAGRPAAGVPPMTTRLRELGLHYGRLGRSGVVGDPPCGNTFTRAPIHHADRIRELRSRWTAMSVGHRQRTVEDAQETAADLPGRANYFVGLLKSDLDQLHGITLLADGMHRSAGRILLDNR